MNTFEKLQQLPAGPPADYLDQMRRSLPTELINEGIICDFMLGIAKDDHVFFFCDIMEHLSDQNTIIESFRNGKYVIYFE